MEFGTLKRKFLFELVFLVLFDRLVLAARGQGPPVLHVVVVVGVEAGLVPAARAPLHPGSHTPLVVGAPEQG